MYPWYVWPIILADSENDIIDLCKKYLDNPNYEPQFPLSIEDAKMILSDIQKFPGIDLGDFDIEISSVEKFYSRKKYSINPHE